MFGWGKQERRETGRFHASPDFGLDVELERSGAEAVVGRLVDLSLKGAKFCVETSLQFSEIVLMRLSVPALDISAAMTSKIMWTRLTPNGAWLVGCSFEETVPHLILDRLAAAGLIERREHPRYVVNLPGVARWELGSQEVQVTLVDFSTGGFCLASETLGMVSSKVLVHFEPAATVFGVVRWRSTDGARHFHGCEFRQQSEGGRGANIIRGLCGVQSIGGGRSLL